MTFTVQIADNCEQQFRRSHIALMEKLPPGWSGFVKLYEQEYNVKYKGDLTFESEAEYTMFLLRWSCDNL